MTHSFWLAFVKGYSTTAGLIIAIGPQNAFILRQGMLKSHILLIAILASIIDIIMIILGVNGIGLVIDSNYYFSLAAKYISVIFLLLYGVKSFYMALLKTQSIEDEHTTGKRSIKSTIITLLVVSFFNPHTYVDTMLLIGSIGAGLPEEQKIYYLTGASIASIMWFFCLSYGSRILIPLFQKPLSWKILNTLIGIVMWFIAYTIYCK